MSFCLIEDLSLSLSFCLKEDLRKEKKEKKKKEKKKEENGLPMVEKSSLLMEELHNLDTISPSNEST